MERSVTNNVGIQRKSVEVITKADEEKLWSINTLNHIAALTTAIYLEVNNLSIYMPFLWYLRSKLFFHITTADLNFSGNNLL